MKWFFGRFEANQKRRDDEANKKNNEQQQMAVEAKDNPAKNPKKPLGSTLAAIGVASAMADAAASREQLGLLLNESHDSSSNAGDSGWSSSASLRSGSFESLDGGGDSVPLGSTLAAVGVASAMAGAAASRERDDGAPELPQVTRDDLNVAIEAGDWAAVGATAALLAAASDSQSFSSRSRRSGTSASRGGSSMSSMDAARAAELDHLVAAGDWEGVVLAAAKFEATEYSSSKGSQIGGSGTGSSEYSGTGSHGYSPSTSVSESPSKIKKRDEIREEVEALVRRVVPDEIGNVDEMMMQFKGREEELVETLRTMQERQVAQKARVQAQQAKRDAKMTAAAGGAGLPDPSTSTGGSGMSAAAGTRTDQARVEEANQKRRDDVANKKKEAQQQTATCTDLENDRQALQSQISEHPKPVSVSSLYVQFILTSEVLGEGFFGTVHRGYDKVLRIYFAVKSNRVPVHMLPTEHLESVKKSFKIELKTLHEFNHPNIVALKAYHMTPDFSGKLFLLYELGEKGALRGFYNDNVGRDRLSSFQQRVQIALEVMTAIQFLHEGTKQIKQCFHRDIKPDNIVLMGDMTAKLIDCGLAKLVPRMGNASASSRGVKGTYEYMCPQYQRNQLDEYKAECDIFSFGVVLAELWTGHVQNHEDSTTGKRVNYYEKYVEDQEDVLADMDDALDISDCTGMPEYAKDFAQLSLECMSSKLENRPAGVKVLSRLRKILAEREQDSKENADIQQKQEAEHPPASSEIMQCRDCRLKNVRCHPTPMGYICLPCLMFDTRRRVVAEIRESRYENQKLHEKTHATLDSFSGVLASLDARLVNQIPALLVLIPSERSSFQEHPRAWLKDKARTKYYIYFVCAHSFRAVRTPLKFRVSKEWVLRIAPFLACSLYVLQISGKLVTGINLDVVGAIAEQFDTAKLTEMLESVMNLLEENLITDHVDLLDSLRSKRLDSSNLRRLDKDSMDPIVELALAQRDWFHEMKHVRNPSGPGRSMWILNEYARDFETIV